MSPFDSPLVAFASLVTAVVLEAAPFLAVGALISSVVHRWVPATVMLRLIPRHLAGRVGLGLVAGCALPTCECGVVPVVRRLIARGVPVETAIAYLLAAPVINPVVLTSTWVAFSSSNVGEPLFATVARVVLVAVPATGVALALAGTRSSAILRGPVELQPLTAPDAAPHTAHGADDCGCGHDHSRGGLPAPLAVLADAGAEFLEMGAWLIVGAAASAAFKIFVPLSVVTDLATSPAAAIAGMMGLAMLLSICSEADAFVATSFSTLPRMSQVAFTAIGPMVDVKLVLMFSRVFTPRVVAALVIVPTVCVFLLSVVFAYLHMGML